MILLFLSVGTGRRTLTYIENVSVLREKKRGQFCTQKVSVFTEIGVFFSLRISEKGSFFKSGNVDMSSLSSASAGTGFQTTPPSHLG